MRLIKGGISTVAFSGGASLAGITRGLASNAASSILSGLSDSCHADSTTHAAVSQGTISIRDQGKQTQDLGDLSRDTEHANQGLSPIFDKEKAQQRLAESQRISEIGGQVADIVRTNGEIQAAKAKQDPSERAKAAAALKASGKAVTDAAIDNKITESVMQRYGTGSDLQRGIQAATAALQGLAGGNLTAAALDASSPYIAGLIHNATTTTDSQGHSEVNTAANLAAHALVNVAVALAEGGNSRDALSRASGAVSGEAIGMMAKAYYNKDAKDLTEQERQTVSALATAAAGLAGGLVGDSTASAATAAQAGKNAVENNHFGWDEEHEKEKEHEKEHGAADFEPVRPGSRLPGMVDEDGEQHSGSLIPVPINKETGGKGGGDSAAGNIQGRTESTVKGVTTITYPDGISFKINQPEHLAQLDGYSQKKGITGAHNADIFNKAAVVYNVKILSQESEVNGITHIKYQIPAKDRAGNIVGYKTEILEKTIYDPKVFSDEKILKLGQQAAANGYKDAIASGKREFMATAGGVKFQVYLDQKNGIVTNFFPVTK